MVNPTGSTNVDCVGIVGGSFKAEDEDRRIQAADAAAKTRKRNSIIIGVTVTLALLLLLGGGLFTFLYMRRKKVQREAELGPDLTPRQFQETQETGGQVLTINSFISQGGSPARSPKSPPFSETSSHSQVALTSAQYAAAAPFDPYHETQPGTTSNRQSGSSHGNADRPGFAKFPSTSVRRSKAAEAGYGASRSPDRAYPAYPPGSISSSSNSGDPSGRVERSASALPLSQPPRTPLHIPARSNSLQENGPDPDGTPRPDEIIFQHRDAGLVRELPPPYADRSTPGPAP